MGTLILTGQAAGGSNKMRQLIPLLFSSLGQTVFSQSCWQCLGTGSDLSACAVPGNQTMEVAYTSQTYETSGLANICMTKVVFNVENCPANGNCQNQAQLVQVSRGLPELELEYQMFMSNEMATNATGTVCTSNGVFLTCTSLCSGNLCNSEVLSMSLASYEQTVQTECISCAAVSGSTGFNDCLMGSNLGNATKSCTASNKDVGNSNLLGGMCVTVVNYNNQTMAPVSVYRGCGVSPQSLIYPVGELEYSTLGQCSPAQISLNGNTMDTISCVKGYVQDLETEEGAYVANNNRPGPMNATCLQCNAVIGDMQFTACLNPNASSSGLAAQGVGEAVCSCGTNACMVTTLYNSNYTVIGVQRGCGNAPGTQSQDVCDYSDPSNVDTSNVLCTSQCTASGTPCNNYNNEYDQNSPGPSGSGAFFVSLSTLWSLAFLMFVSLLL